MDRFAITLGSLIELPAEVVKGEGEATSEPEQAPEDLSAKAIQLIDLLSAIHNGDPQRKSRECSDGSNCNRRRMVEESHL